MVRSNSFVKYPVVTMTPLKYSVEKIFHNIYLTMFNGVVGVILWH
jgi:hypothetical protein